MTVSADLLAILACPSADHAPLRLETRRRRRGAGLHVLPEPVPDPRRHPGAAGRRGASRARTAWAVPADATGAPARGRATVTSFDPELLDDPTALLAGRPRRPAAGAGRRRRPGAPRRSGWPTSSASDRLRGRAAAARGAGRPGRRTRRTCPACSRRWPRPSAPVLDWRDPAAAALGRPGRRAAGGLGRRPAPAAGRAGGPGRPARAGRRGGRAGRLAGGRGRRPAPDRRRQPPGRGAAAGALVGAGHPGAAGAGRARRWPDTARAAGAGRRRLDEVAETDRPDSSAFTGPAKLLAAELAESVPVIAGIGAGGDGGGPPGRRRGAADRRFDGDGRGAARRRGPDRLAAGVRRRPRADFFADRVERGRRPAAAGADRRRRATTAHRSDPSLGQPGRRGRPAGRLRRWPGWPPAAASGCRGCWCRTRRRWSGSPPPPRPATSPRPTWPWPAASTRPRPGWGSWPH